MPPLEKKRKQTAIAMTAAITVRTGFPALPRAESSASLNSRTGDGEALLAGGVIKITIHGRQAEGGTT
jgi:hypothetical protein